MNIDSRPFYMKNELIHSSRSRDKSYSSSGCRQSRNDDEVSYEPWDDCHVTARNEKIVFKSSSLARDTMPLSAIPDQGISLDELLTLCLPRRRRHDHERFAQGLMNTPSNWACMPRRPDAKKRRLDESSTGSASHGI